MSTCKFFLLILKQEIVLLAWLVSKIDLICDYLLRWSKNSLYLNLAFCDDFYGVSVFASTWFPFLILGCLLGRLEGMKSSFVLRLGFVLSIPFLLFSLGYELVILLPYVNTSIYIRIEI